MHLPFINHRILFKLFPALCNPKYITLPCAFFCNPKQTYCFNTHLPCVPPVSRYPEVHCPEEQPGGNHHPRAGTVYVRGHCVRLEMKSNFQQMQSDFPLLSKSNFPFVSTVELSFQLRRWYCRLYKFQFVSTVYFLVSVTV